MEGDQLDQVVAPPASAQDIPPTKKVKKQFPQKTIDQFWEKFVTKFPGKVETILPSNIYAKSRAAKTPEGVVHGQAATKGYDEARAECVEAVNKVSKECRRVNMKYRDPHFDIDFDLKWNRRDCLDGLTMDRWDEQGLAPKSVKRVPDIYDKPVFYDNGASASDVRQGADGDCWFMSALCALANEKHLIDKICVARDEKVGVYGFVFHRDGSWMHTVIDDKLYLRHADYAESVEEKYTWDQLNRADSEDEYRKTYQTGSRALYFAQCSSENETWLPLLEKAYAKAHGDYKAIDGGFTGEALEDLTGGVTTELFTTDILDLDQFWKDELMQVNKDFLFGCATGTWDGWLGGGDKTGEFSERKGVVPMHAYSIMEAREVKDLRLVRVRNPWGVKEWTGAWSDGSEQWTPEWMELLGHKFGNDGMFWISYKDLIRKYQAFDRTRLFGPEWSITQQWTSLDVPWSVDYNETKFSIKLTKKSHVVIVLSQLDERYFYGLEGQYNFRLHFRLEKDGEHDYIVRSHGNYLMHRSVSADLELDAGIYSVLMRVTAKRNPAQSTPEEVVREYSKRSQDKLLMIGMAYDLAHAKAQIKETEQEKALREQREKKRAAAEHKKVREEFRAEKYRKWLHKKKEHERAKRHAQAKEQRRRKKADEHKAGDVPNDTAKALPMPPVNSETPKAAEEQATGGASGKTPLPTVPELPSPATEATSDPQPASVDIPDKDKTTEDKIKQFNLSLAAIPHLNLPTATFHPPPATPSTAAPPPSTAAGLDEDYDSDASFDSSIDTDLDDLATAAPVSNNEAAAPAPADDDNDDDAEFENDPWNAVCIVGLRVYSKDPDLSVLIVRPKNEDEDEETPLDVDDPSKGASEEPIPGAGAGEEKKEGVVVS